MSVRSLSSALVLGPTPVATAIADRLRELNYETTCENQLPEPLPLPSDPEANEKLRSILFAYAKKVGAQEGSGSALVHPGTSLWAERTELFLIAQEANLVLLAPPPRVTSLYSNKLSFLMEADRIGIPTLLIQTEPLSTLREIERIPALNEVQFPFVLKSVRGGGEIGVRVIQEASDLENQVPLWLDQLRANLGEAMVFAERYIDCARHITLPFARFRSGEWVDFPMTDASLQWKRRKLIEFCPVLDLSPALKKSLLALGRQLAEKTDFVGVGTYEFLLDGSAAFLIDGSARLPTGFRLWEALTGTHTIDWQLASLLGRPEDEARLRDPHFNGDAEKRSNSAVAIRLYAEDPIRDLPQPGKVIQVSEKRLWDFPDARAELDLAVHPGFEVTWDMEGFLGAIWITGEDRERVLSLAQGVLSETWIAGSLGTNERFLQEAVAHPFVHEGMFHAGFLEEEFIPNSQPASELWPLFVHACSSPQEIGEYHWLLSERRILPKVLEQENVEWVEGPHEEGPSRWGKIRLHSSSQAVTYPVFSHAVGENRWQVRVGAWIVTVKRRAIGSRKPKDFRPKVSALVSGRVRGIFFREGAEVNPHEPIVIVESLRQLVPHALPVRGRMIKLLVGHDTWVHVGDPLLEVELL